MVTFILGLRSSVFHIVFTHLEKSKVRLKKWAIALTKKHFIFLFLLLFLESSRTTKKTQVKNRARA